jgi:hypothetical protein
LLDLLSTLTAALLLLLKAECDVPFVSAFYQWLAKAPLTPLDLVALIAAIPTTALYKAVTKAAPFPDQASVDLFKTSYTRQVLLARSGLGPSRDVVAVARDNPPSFTFQQFLDLANVTCTGTYGLLMTYPDTAAATDGTDGPASTAVKNASIIGFAAELGAQAFSFPWSSSTGPPDCVSSNGVKKWLWLHSVMGIVLDGLFLYHDGTFPENNNTAFGPVITFIWGLGRAGVYATGFTKLSIYSKISYGVEAAVPCLKIFRLPVLARPPVLAALALIDYVGYVTIATTTFLDSLPPHDGGVGRGQSGGTGRRAPPTGWLSLRPSDSSTQPLESRVRVSAGVEAPGRRAAMKLTEENSDYTDCWPVRTDAEVTVKWETPDWMQATIDKRRAELGGRPVSQSVQRIRTQSRADGHWAG